MVVVARAETGDGEDKATVAFDLVIEVFLFREKHIFEEVICFISQAGPDTSSGDPPTFDQVQKNRTAYLDLFLKKNFKDDK